MIRKWKEKRRLKWFFVRSYRIIHDYVRNFDNTDAQITILSGILRSLLKLRRIFPENVRKVCFWKVGHVNVSSGNTSSSPPPPPRQRSSASHRCIDGRRGALHHRSIAGQREAWAVAALTVIGRPQAWKQGFCRNIITKYINVDEIYMG